MTLALSQFLGHPTVRRADPAFLGREADLDRPVTWVHSSEIYEIAPLLSGGEVLLTTGLGLAGADAGTRRHWIRDLASRQVAAVALEPGRSLPELPAEMADEARRAGLPLIVLRQVVPFAEICREVNSDLLTTDLARLRRGDELTTRLHEQAADGAGLSELVSQAAQDLGEPIEVRTLSGQVVAAAGGPQRAGTVKPDAAHSVVRTAGAPWGQVLLGTRVTVETSFLAQRVAAVVGLVVQRSTLDGPGASDPGVSLLTDLLDRPRFTNAAQLLTRGALAGFCPAPGQLVVGLAGACADPRRAAVVLGRVAGLGPHLLAAVRGQVLGLVAVDPSAPDPAGAVAALVAQAATRQCACLVVGPPRRLEEAADSLLRAREGLDLSPGDLGARTWRDSTAQHLLARLPAADVQALVEDGLEPLRRWDAEHGTILVETLAAWLENGLNVAATARDLGIRRQTMHQRLDRITGVLGYDPGQGSALAHLVLATAAAQHGHGPDPGRPWTQP
ncbi:PucR family transcriptional regulator [Ornithinimicrobium pratense]|uniref:PucR family transcriptional regulator n=1 Tax=Ornithinimicrobium pratense TaxID=2593973 RepID=A0A5J6V4W6_9MICO|nr:PucR family transcriptional regulator [Ornithinimicrobium pratense]QFG68216.1 PucR family transcriptional regulator [Ornithinimicrobium pratense]